MKLRYTIVTAVLAAAVLAAGPAGGQVQSIFDITVAKHTDTATDGAAAANYTAGTTLLQTDNMICADVPCCVVLNKSGATGSVGVAGDGLDVITSTAELNSVFAFNTHHVKVVTSASNCCGVAGAILGCASTTTRNIVMVEGAPADVWAHEFGHTKGLAHNNTCAQLIMHATNLNTNAVTNAECTSFRAMPDRMGMPCGAVPVGVEDLEVVADAGGVTLRWRLSAEARTALEGISVQRAEAAEGPYVQLTRTLLAPEAAMQYLDAAVEPGRAHWYRLVLVGLDASLSYAGPVRVEMANALRTALATPFESAGASTVELRFSIGGSAVPVQIGVFDVSGRRLQVIDLGVRTAGQYVRTWDRRGASGERLARGVYLVQMQAGEALLAKKLVLVRE